MNPVENEAVVAHVVSKYANSLAIVDVSDRLPSLIRYPGMTSWRVINKEGEEYESAEAVPIPQKRRYPISLFPKAEYKDLGLDRCLRIYPHLQNTGGFFVAVLRKIGEIEVTPNKLVGEGDGSTAGEATTAKVPVIPKSGKRSFFKPPADGEFRRLDVLTDTVLESIFSWFGIDRQIINDAGYGFYVRSERNPIKSIIVVSPQGDRLLRATVRSHLPVNANEIEAGEGRDAGFNGSLKLVNAGVRAFESGSRPVPVSCAYRLLYESLDVIRPLITKRLVPVTKEQMKQLLSTNDSVRMAEIEATLGQGGAVAELVDHGDGVGMTVPVWISERGVKAFVAQANKPALLLQLA
jgi:hypothetical protein